MIRVSAGYIVWNKSTKEILMQKDETRELAIAGLFNGAKADGLPAKTGTSVELTMSRQVHDGYWIGAKTRAVVTISCPQTEDDIHLGLNVCEELTMEKSLETIGKVQAIFDSFND